MASTTQTFLLLALLSCLLASLFLPTHSSSSDRRFSHKPTRPRHLNFGKFHHFQEAKKTYHLPALAAGPPAGPKPRKYISLAVEGVVECQNCKYVNTRSLQDAKPLAGAKIRLACRNIHYKTFVYETAYTNTQGYFYIRVKEYDFRKYKGVQSCIVYLVSSPSQSCFKLTNINSGMIGSPLTRQKVYPDEILYSVGPFAFAPPSCKHTTPLYSHNSPPYPPAHHGLPPSSPPHKPSRSDHPYPAAPPKGSP